MIIRWRGRWRRQPVGAYMAQREGQLGDWMVWAQVVGLGPEGPWSFRVVARRPDDVVMRCTTGQCTTLADARVEASIALRAIVRRWDR